MKRRVWDRVMKRGFDKRSQQTRLLFQQIYTSVQYVFVSNECIRIGR